MKLSRRPAWPITALLIGFPLWWALGLEDFIWIIVALPMGVRMVSWRARGGRALKMPPGFGLWLLFLVCAIAGVAALGVMAPGTAASSVSDRAVSYAYRTASYLAVTVLLLYAGNLSESELPRRRLAWMLGLVGIYATVGGLAAIAAPHFGFSSPVQKLLPASLQSNPSILAETHPALAQIQTVTGGANARPKAPFDYTNAWGDCLTILIPWLIVGWWRPRDRRRALLVVAVVALASVPLLYSLNRGAWIGAALALALLVLRLVARRPRALVSTICAGAILVAILGLATPVAGVIGKRLSNPGSYSLRDELDRLAVRDALSSPVIGYGDTRKQLGSQHSIAIGPTSKCPRCGQQEVGGTGQLWTLLVCNGVVGAVLYIGFFVAGVWRFRRDRTAYGAAGLVVLLLSLLYLFTYSAVIAPLGFTMLAFGLLWRNEQHRGSRLAPNRVAAATTPHSERRTLTAEPVA